MLGVNAVVQTPSWADHLYSCTYQYPNGSMVLSVKGGKLRPTDVRDLRGTLADMPDTERIRELEWAVAMSEGAKE